MKLTAQLNQENYQINIEREGEHVVAQIDARSYAISIRDVSDGVFVLIKDGRVFECLVERQPALPEEYRVHLRNRTYATTITDPRRLRSVHRTNVHAGNGKEEIRSPMAGKVVRVLVEKGSHVMAGDRIVVVEAMKMQNELKSPRDGVVTEIRAEAGSTVNAGEVLVIVEANKGE